VEPITPKPSVIVVGAGHVGKAVAHLAKWLGYHVAVSDDRVELCTPESVPDSDEYYPGPLAELPKQLTITAQTHLVLTTRSVDIDVPGLPGLLETPAAYIGVIGSRRRWETTRTQLIEKGVSEDLLARVHSPMGLEIAAETPEEIAVSIMAEIIRLGRIRDGHVA
jgi:xanthine dehydrogenase accessory factor